MDGIKKQIRIKDKDVRTHLNYVQGSNGINIVLEIIDFELPQDAQARIYLKKPSGKEVYNAASIAGNTIIITPTTQMFAEHGKQFGQVQLIKDGSILTTYMLEFDIEKNIIEESAVESTNEYGVLDELIAEAQTAISNAQTATSAANNAANSANKAASDADAAATAANNAAEELQEKVDAGDFSATVSVGTVTTGNPGTQVSVVNSGTNKDAVLDFTIPRGDTGGVENPDTVIDTSTMSSQNVPTTEAVYGFVRAPIGDTSYIASPMVFGDWGNWFSSMPNGSYIRIGRFQFSKSQPYMLTLSIGVDRLAYAEYRILVHFQKHSTAGNILDARYTVSCMTAKTKNTNYPEQTVDFTKMPIYFLSDGTYGYIAIGDGVQRWNNIQVKLLDISIFGSVDDENWKTKFRNDWGFACMEEIVEPYTILKTVQPDEISMFDAEAYKISDETISAYETLGWVNPMN